MISRFRTIFISLVISPFIAGLPTIFIVSLCASYIDENALKLLPFWEMCSTLTMVFVKSILPKWIMIAPPATVLGLYLFQKNRQITRLLYAFAIVSISIFFLGLEDYDMSKANYYLLILMLFTFTLPSAFCLVWLLRNIERPFKSL